MVAVIVIVIVAVLVLVTLWRTLRIVPQARAGVVERFGRYSRTLNPGLQIVVPFVDRIRPLIDLREQVVSFQPQPVITEDNLVVNIDTVLYYQVTDPKSASYEIANYVQAIEQLTVTTLRNVIGTMSLEKTLTSRDQINAELRGVLDDATGKWGIHVNRVELKAVDPPASIQDAMEKQMRADRDKRAAILQAEGEKQSQILTAEGKKQAAILEAEGEKQAMALRAEGQAKAIGTVFEAIHEGKPDANLLAYSYLQVLPQIAQGESNKVWIIPSDLQQAAGRIAGVVKDAVPIPPARPLASTLPARSAATPTAPLGSATTLSRSNRNAIASTISSSLTVTTSSTRSRLTSNVSSPGSAACNPSAIVRGTSIRMRRPASSERRVSSPASGSTPTTRIPGRSAFAAVEQPAISPPPPIGTTSRSRSGTSRRSSSATVPWPAITSGSSYGFTSSRPRSAASCAPISSRLSVQRS